MKKGSKRTTIDDLISSQKLRKVSRVDALLDNETIVKINSICNTSGYSRTEVLEALILSGLETYKIKSKPFYSRNQSKD